MEWFIFCISIRCIDWSLSRVFRMFCNFWVFVVVWLVFVSVEILAFRRMFEDEVLGGGKFLVFEK